MARMVTLHMIQHKICIYIYQKTKSLLIYRTILQNITKTLTLSVHVNEFILIITHLLISHFKYIFQGKKYCLKYHELLIHKYHYVSGEWHRTCFIIKRSNYLRFDIKSAGLYCHFLFFFCFFWGGFSMFLFQL